MPLAFQMRTCCASYIFSHQALRCLPCDNLMFFTVNIFLLKMHKDLFNLLFGLCHQVQNADDNVYPGNVEPTLNFILMEGCIVVLNNERGFSGDNIRALCDVGNSTKKEPSAGYIGKKGIGFKSVFRVP